MAKPPPNVAPGSAAAAVACRKGDTKWNCPGATRSANVTCPLTCRPKRGSDIWLRLFTANCGLRASSTWGTSLLVRYTSAYETTPDQMGAAGVPGDGRGLTSHGARLLCPPTLTC